MIDQINRTTLYATAKHTFPEAQREAAFLLFRDLVRMSSQLNAIGEWAKDVDLQEMPPTRVYWVQSVDSSDRSIWAYNAEDQFFDQVLDEELITALNKKTHFTMLAPSTVGDSIYVVVVPNDMIGYVSARIGRIILLGK